MRTKGDCKSPFQGQRIANPLERDATVDCLSVQTPNGYLYFITDTGDYIVTFTFPDGDVYYGEFTVTD